MKKTSINTLDNIIAESDTLGDKVRFVAPACHMLWCLHPKEELGPEQGIGWVFPYILVTSRNASPMLSTPLVAMCVVSLLLATVYHQPCDSALTAYKK